MLKGLKKCKKFPFHPEMKCAVVTVEKCLLCDNYCS